MNRLGLEALEDRSLMAADAVLEWNKVLLEAIRVDKSAPPVASRAMAIVHTAIYDSVNAIDRSHAFYAVSTLAPPKASMEASVAAAAHKTLVALFPSQAATFNAYYTASLAAIPDGKSETDGIKLGESVAAKILALRSSDGSTNVVSYVPGDGMSDWVPTKPGFLPALLPQWPDVTPWAMTSGAQFRPEAPPALDSAEFLAAFNEVKELGSTTSAARTADQTDIAKFWANGGGTATPPGHWNMAAQIVSAQQNLDLVENARLFALLNIALADAAIASWDAKYEFDLCRPVTAIANGDVDGVDGTVGDAAWTPLLVTPPFPTYTSGHSTFSAAAARVLAGFFGTDQITFTLPSENPTVGSRTYSSFSAAAHESGMSRIYGGIHFQFDNVAGLTSGGAIGDYVLSHLLRAVPQTATAGIVDQQLVVIGTDQPEFIHIRQHRNQLQVWINGSLVQSFDVSAVQSIAVDSRGGNDGIVVAAKITLAAQLYGGRGNDILIGGSGNDELDGEEGRNLLFGRRGEDTLVNGRGKNAAGKSVKVAWLK